MAIATGIGLAISAYGAYKNSQSKGSPGMSMAEQNAADMSRDQWNTYNSTFLPRQKELISRVFDQTTSPAAEAARAGAEAAKAADNSEQITQRNARRAGIELGSPQFAALMRKAQADRAGLVSSAKTFGRRNADQINLSRQMGVLGLGQNLPQLAASNNTTAANMAAKNYELESARDAATGELYGAAASYGASALQNYLKNRQAKSLQPVTVTAKQYPIEV